MNKPPPTGDTKQIKMRALFFLAGLLAINILHPEGGRSQEYVPREEESSIPILPAPSGKHSIGIKSLSFERTGTNGEVRQLNIWVFYPSKKAADQKQRNYLSDTLLLAAMKQEKYLNFSEDTLDNWVNIKTHSFADAPPIKRKFPIAFILHGRGSSKSNYTSLAEEICSHGYIVAISDHPGSGLTILKDGTKVTLANPSDLKVEVEQMSKDVCFLVNELTKNDFLSPLIDAKNMGMIGHSLGSMAVFNIALSNCGFNAAINFDGYPFGEAVPSGINIPHLTIWGELPTWLSVPVDTLNVRRYKIWNNFLKMSNPDFFLLKIAGMYHTDFNDLIFLRSDSERAKKPGAINAQRGFRITSDLTVTYLNHRLKGRKRQDVERELKDKREVSKPISLDNFNNQNK